MVWTGPAPRKPIADAFHASAYWVPVESAHVHTIRQPDAALRGCRITRRGNRSGDFMDSSIIAEVPIVSCSAFVEVVFSTSPHAKDDTGFSYILYALSFCCPACSAYASRAATITCIAFGSAIALRHPIASLPPSHNAGR